MRPATIRFFTRSVVMVAGIMTAAPAKAGLMQWTITLPGGFVQVEATDIDGLHGGGITPRADLQIQFGVASADFHEQSFSGTNSATTSASFSTASITKSATTVPGPGLSGQPGFFVFTNTVTGTLSASGANGPASVLTDVYKNGVDSPQNSFWNPDRSNLIATDRQQAFWACQPMDSHHDTVNATLRTSRNSPTTHGMEAKI